MRNLVSLLLLAVLAGRALAAEADYEWPMIAFDSGWTAHSPDPRVKPPFRLKWATLAHTSQHSGVTVAGGKVFARGCCLDAETGAILWKANLGKNPPAYHKGRVYVGGGKVAAYDASSGKLVWVKRGYLNSNTLKVGLIVSEGAVYSGQLKEHEGNKSYFLTALDVDTGNEIWSTPLIPAEGKPGRGHELGLGMSAVAAGGGRVLVCTHSPKMVFALDQKTGKELWRKKGLFALFSLGTDGNHVWAADQVQGLWALDAKSGKKLWQWGGSKKDRRGAHYATTGTACHPPAVADGMLFVSNYGRQYMGLDARDGKQLWIAGDGGFYGPGGCGPPSTAAGFIYTNAVVGSQYHGTFNRFGVYAVDGKTGKPVWRHPLANKSCARVSIAYGRIYVVTRTELFCFEPVSKDYKAEPQSAPAEPAAPLRPMVKPFGGKPGTPEAGGKPKGGVDWPMYGGCPARCGLEVNISMPIKEAWKSQTGGKVKSSPVISGGMVYVGSDSGKLFALELKTGKEKWSVEITPPEESKINVKWIRSAPAVAEGIVVCGADDGVLRAFDTVNGKPKWEFKTAGRIRSSPAIIGNRVVFGSWDGRCYCVRLSDGKEYWRYRVGMPGVRVYAPPAVAAGRVYVGAFEDFDIWALDLGTGKPLDGYQQPNAAGPVYPSRFDRVQGLSVYRGMLATIQQAYDPLVDAATGKKLGRGTHTPSLRTITGTPAFCGGKVFTYRDPLGVRLADVASGKKPTARPKVRLSGVLTTPLIAQDLMIAPTAVGTLVVYRLPDENGDDPAKPAWKWSNPSRAPFSTAPAAAGGFIVVGSDDGHVYGFRYSEGKAAEIKKEIVEDTVNASSKTDKPETGLKDKSVTKPSHDSYTYKVVNVYPHDKTAWTQGLVFDNGFLYEGTGRNGRSSLRKVKIETGEVLKEHRLDRKYFGEGITIYKDRIIQLTWRKKTGFVYAKESFKLLKEFSYTTQGWGIAHDGKRLIMSDGSATLRFLDPETFSETGKVRILDRNRPVKNINELEYIKGRIYANIYKTDRIAVIDPETGRVTGWIELKGILKPEYRRGHRPNVLNGIAYNSKNGNLYVTGKLWPKLFEITISQIKK